MIAPNLPTIQNILKSSALAPLLQTHKHHIIRLYRLMFPMFCTSVVSHATGLHAIGLSVRSNVCSLLLWKPVISESMAKVSQRLRLCQSRACTCEWASHLHHTQSESVSLQLPTAAAALNNAFTVSNWPGHVGLRWIETSLLFNTSIQTINAWLSLASGLPSALIKKQSVRS